MKHAPRKPIRLSILSTPAHLPVVRAALEKMCEAIGFDAEAVGKIVLAADEALANVIQHAYRGADDKPIDIELSPLVEDSHRGLRISIRDYGERVDRSRIRSRDLADVRPGGLGVHIMTHCMDELEYRPADGGGTVLTMVKDVCSRPKETKT
jgi:anti-sigma regulatory factor (Ser/Thr protein kinase)